MKRIDWTIWFGVIAGLGALFLGAWLEGLNITFLWHPTAALIVGGGTLAAVLIRRGGEGLRGAISSVWQLRLKDDDEDAHKLELSRLAWLARSANKSGVKVYENYADSTTDPLIAQGLILVAERANQEHIKQILTRTLDYEDEKGTQDAATLEAAGGFAPTFGILGAVIGLIGVLRVIDRPEVLGIGIATAFVATIYGIGTANLFFFPLAARLRARHELRMKRREEIAQVIIALNERETPRAIINQFNLPR